MAEKRFWTVLVEWPGGKDTREELDIEAESEYLARRLAMYQLGKDYEAGWRILRCERREPEVTGWPPKEEQS